MITVVRPRIASRSPTRMRASVRGVDRCGRIVEDQDPRIDDQRAAIASRWRWPPESVIPRSPITVS